MRQEAQAAEPGATRERLEEMLAGVDYIHIALHNVKSVMEHHTERFSDNYRAFIYDGGNFRENIATLKKYKGNRDKLHKPKYYKEIKEYLVDRWKAELISGQESDDALGIAQCSAPAGSTIICSNDKDMQMIPGYHYNWIKEEITFVNEEEADMMLFWQMLVGDSSDNIPGIDRIGAKTATKLLSECHSVQDAQRLVQNLYAKQYGTDAGRVNYNEISNLLWIRRAPDQVCPF
jgi:5'-3' exonuclease